ncbi:MAG: RNA polymerase sigma-70 factor [Carboxylicivirga sp.]|jgi:RNA polymerase sigma-70 factor (ECF subfamily)|nr:RNA polymerase sigma-70 factor [Carboxylicivirga sp.]
MNKEETFLISQLQSGNKAAFEYIFKSYYDSLCLYSYRYVKDKVLAEDVVADFFERFYNKRLQLNVNVSIRSYLFTSIRNLSLNSIRDQKNNLSIDEIEPDESSDILGVKPKDFSSLLDEDVQAKIEEAINLLPDQCRLIFQMSRFQKMKYKEISDELDISVKTVETQISRALKKLRTELKDYLHLFII